MKNILSRDKYIIDDYLFSLLYGVKNDYLHNIKNKGLYLVGCRTYKDQPDNNTVFYNYISYHPAFFNVIMHYIYIHRNPLNLYEEEENLFYEFRKILFFIDQNLFNLYITEYLMESIYNNNYQVIRDYYIWKNKGEATSYQKIFDLLFKLKYEGEVKNLANLIDIAIKN